MPLEKGIYLEVTPALGSTSLGNHAYLVFRDGKGNAEVIRGGPDSSLIVDGKIKVEAGVPLAQSEDAYKPGETPETRHAHKLDLGGRAPEMVWDGMVEKAEEIAAAEIDYDLNPDQNSNSVVRSVLDDAGIPVEKAIPPGIGQDDLPGIENDLTRFPRQESESRPENLLDVPVTEWSEADVSAVMDSDAYVTRSHPDRALAHEKVRQWHDHFFGNGPQKTNATGRPLPPEPIRAIPSGSSRRDRVTGGGGPVSVRAHSREGDGVSVRAHSRSLPA